jgi:hypothetical protein
MGLPRLRVYHVAIAFHDIGRIINTTFDISSLSSVIVIKKGEMMTVNDFREYVAFNNNNIKWNSVTNKSIINH